MVPREDAGSWLIREPTADIFQAGSVTETINQGPGKFDDQFQIYFADDTEELLEAYFRDFTVSINKKILKDQVVQREFCLG